MKITHLGLICLLLLSSCVSNKGASDILEPPYLVSLERAIDNHTPTGIGKIGSSITYIPLETSDNSLVGRILNVVVSDSMILLHDVNRRLLVFDRAGKFMRQIGRQGNGPGEYINIFDFCLSPDGESIYINGGDGRVLRYGVDGEFLGDHHIANIHFSRLIPYDDRSFVFGVGGYPLSASPSGVAVFISDLEGNVEASFNTFFKRDDGVFLSFCSLYSFGGDVRYNEPLSNTLVTVTRDSLATHAVFDLGAKGAPVEDYLGQQFPEAVALRRISESTGGLYFDMIDFAKNETMYGYFDKRSGETRVVGNKGFTNDLDGGLPFFPKYVYNDNVMFDWIDAHALKEHLLTLDATEMTRLYGDRFTELAALAATLLEDSNPVIVIATLKK